MRPALEQHERIKMRLRVAGSSLAEVARELGVAGTSVTSVSQGYRRSRRIESAIADKLGVVPSSLWPDRYPDGAGGDDRSPVSRNLDCMGGGSLSPVFC
ncbi:MULTISPECIES: helix-turn-helix domain-containing protein [Pseudomonadota]|jgi:lambda repressor-like predicted transcriptional regulator|nr:MULTISPECIES: helix-turn-helix domain-containing protein [Pseudomonadota]